MKNKQVDDFCNFSSILQTLLIETQKTFVKEKSRRQQKVHSQQDLVLSVNSLKVLFYLKVEMAVTRVHPNSLGYVVRC